MAASDTILPELVFAPNHSGYDGDDRQRLDDFLHWCKRGAVDGWTCKKSARRGDIYLYWFGAPVSMLAGLGVADGHVREEHNDGLDWTDSPIVRYCGFDPLMALKQSITLEDIKGDRLLAKWWDKKPFRGRPRQLAQPDAKRLTALILSSNPRQTRVAKLLRPWVSAPGVTKPLTARSEVAGGDKSLAEDLKSIQKRKIDPTTKDALIKARVGQGNFRTQVLDRWGNCCSVTRSRTSDVVRASHIKPWRESTDEERLDPNNGLPLVASLDALFDAGLISFDSSGGLLISSELSASERRIFRIVNGSLAKKPPSKTAGFLAYHRKHVFRK